MESWEGDRRRYIIAAGTGHYEDPGIPDLRGVAADVDGIAEIFGSRGYQRVLEPVSADPTAEQFADQLEEWLHRPDQSRANVVVLYYAGHAQSSYGTHRLQFRSSRKSRVSHSLSVSELARILFASTVEHFLLILDTCYAQTGTAEIAEIAYGFRKNYPSSGGRWLLAAARAGDVALDGAFVAALRFGIAHCPAGDRQPYQDFGGVLGRINDYLRDNYPNQRAIWSAVDVSEPPPFLPNPGFLSFLPPEPLDVESQRRIKRGLASHFEPRARGVEAATESGSYFTGRTKVLAELAAWLAEPNGDRMIQVVSGQPGSGKSAVLGRLIALADRHNETARAEAPRGTVPPIGAIDLPIHARGASLEDMTALVGAAIRCRYTTTEDMLEMLRASRRRLTIVVDALDEAGAGVDQHEAIRVAEKLLRPLSEIAGIRLIVGTRHSAISALGTSVNLLDLDSPAYSRPEDVSGYVKRLLLREPVPGYASPYHEKEALAETVARGVARRANTSFLLARMMARALIGSSEVIDTTDADWPRRLPSTAAQAFDLYLGRYGDREQLVRRIMTALAYAVGPGLPWDDIWAPVAGAISSCDCSDEDISWVMEKASSYIVEVPVEGNRSVFRLFHESLAEHLRVRRPLRHVHRRITEALTATVPAVAEGSRDWEAAHPYVRERLAVHAAIGGSLGNLLTEPGFLVNASPATLLPTLRSVASNSDRADRIIAVYRASAHLHQWQPSSQRRHLLAIDATRSGAAWLARELAEQLPWRPVWSTGSQVSGALQATLGGRAGPLYAVQCTAMGGRPVALTCDGHGTVGIWDLETARERAQPDRPPRRSQRGGVHASGRPSHRGDRRRGRHGPDLGPGDGAGARHSLTGHHGAVNAVACTLLEGRPTAVTGGADGTVRIWDLQTAQERRRLTSNNRGAVNAVACTLLEGRPTAASGAGNRVRIWDLLTGEEKVAQAPRGGTVLAASFATLDHNTVLITGASDDRVRILTAVAGKKKASWYGHAEKVTAIAVMRSGPGFTLLTGGVNGQLHLWDPSAGRIRTTLAGHGGAISGVSCTELGGYPVAVTSSLDGTARIWRLDGPVQLIPQRGHSGDVTAVAWGKITGRSAETAGCSDVAVTGSSDGTVRLWNPLTGRVMYTLTAPQVKHIKSVTCAIDEDHSVVIAGCRDWYVPDSHRNRLHVWSLGVSSINSKPIKGHSGTVNAVTYIKYHNRLLAVSGGDDATIRLWDLLEGHPLAVMQTRIPVLAIACNIVSDRPVVVAGGSSGDLQVWDLTNARQLCVLAGHSKPVNAIACATLDELPIAISGSSDHTVRVWDLGNQSQLGVLAGHTGPVSSVTCATLSGLPIAVSGGDDRTIRTWDLSGMRQYVDPLFMPLPVRALSLRDTGELLAAGGWEVLLLRHSFLTQST